MRNPEQFQDKKQRHLSYDEMSAYLQNGRNMLKEWEIGQKEATVVLRPEYENLPIVVLLMTDTHFGSTRVDYDLLNEHFDTVSLTPNFYMVHNGDHTDNFNAYKHPSGMTENPMPPQIEGRVWAEKLIKLDRKSKLLAAGFGNHDDFTFEASQNDYYDTFFSNLSCPIFTEGGILHIGVGTQWYHLAMTHRWWGTSKLNPTNANKRFLEEYPYADISFLGHTHQSEGLHFERGGKDRIGVIGGTYKVDDPFARKRGIGGRAGSPGWAVALWPDRRQMQLFKDVAIADQFLMGMVADSFNTEPYIDPYTKLSK